MISAAIVAVVVRAAFWFRSRLRRRQAEAEQPGTGGAGAVATAATAATEPGTASEEPDRAASGR
ncbi:hypothetical protein ACIQI7_17330 [Kitasatospora sp. NPDC092039]|uniref:hypothetical protein n=1 Tax=Kitasatospora sp. NPDC092039 TaxID=3364086 RepID=UPI0038108934